LPRPKIKAESMETTDYTRSRQLVNSICGSLKVYYFGSGMRC
jgi:hypothetical protein